MNNKKVIFELPEEIEKKGYSNATKAILDSSKINELGWKAHYDINQGLNNTINIIRQISN